MTYSYSSFRILGAALALTAASGLQGAGATESETGQNQWGFNLSNYMWFAGVKGDFSAGSLSQSVDVSFIDIAGKLRNFPMAFMGRLEAHYDRLGFYMDGNYMDLSFKPRFDGGISRGLDSTLSIMDYGVMYRLAGKPAGERIAEGIGKKHSNILDLYVGGRTFWIDNQVAFGNLSATSSASMTTAVLGGRVVIEFSPEWFMLADVNGGGFGADNVDFTGAVLGAVGYRMSMLGLPASVEAGYKAVRLNISKPGIETNVTLNGPFIGLTGYW